MAVATLRVISPTSATLRCGLGFLLAACVLALGGGVRQPASPFMPDKLAEIMAAKRAEVATRTRPVRADELARLAAIQRAGPSFAEALAAGNKLSIIAEIKRRSPSAGAIAPALDATEQARRYHNAGVDAISVLTDEAYFGGSIRDLWDVNDLLAHRSDGQPTLRKDFFVDPIQIVEAAEAGARAILIIVRALQEDEMRRLAETATAAGLDSLWEVHSEPEIETAVRLGASIIGVNNRDLARFRTDLGISERLLPLIPSDTIKVSESGIATLEDAARVRDAGADAILVGESLVRITDDEELETLVAAWQAL